MPADLAAIPPLYLILLAALVVAAVAGRLPVIGSAVRLVVLGVTVLVMVIAFSNEEQGSRDLAWLTRTIGQERQQVVGGEVRVRMSPDGHFWVRAKIGDAERRMLVDSGATFTALSVGTAQAAGVRIEKPAVPILLRTANGTVTPDTASIGELRFGAIVARDLDAVVSPAFGDTDVLGMNFLSRLKSWRVEGRTLILVPNHPQPVDDA